MNQRPTGNDVLDIRRPNTTKYIGVNLRRILNEAEEVRLRSPVQLELWLRWYHHFWHYPQPSDEQRKEAEWAQQQVLDVISRITRLDKPVTTAAA